MKKQYILACMLMIILKGFMLAQPGSLDQSFSSDGVIHAALYEGLSSIASNVLIQQDGKILTTGGSNIPGGSYVGLLQRFLPDGGDDLEFNGTGNVVISLPDKPCYGINSIQQPDGKILTLAGHNANTEDVIALFRTNLDGSPDEGFGPQGMVDIDPGFTEQAPRYMIRQPDGKLVISGYAKLDEDLFQKFLVLRCLPDGSLDTSFGEKGYVVTAIGEANTKSESVCLQQDGKIVAAGNGYFNGKDNIVVVRYLPDGTPDKSFHDDGIVNISLSNNNFRALRVLMQADGKIVVAGYIRTGNSDSDFVAIRLNSNGHPDTGFNEDGIARIAISAYADEARAMVIQQDGKIVLGGYAHSNSPEASNSVLVRLTPDGYPDPTFGDNGIFESDHDVHENSILGLEAQPDGKFVGVGRCYVGNFTKCLVARFISGLTVSTSESSSPFSSISIFPNPVMDRLTIAFEFEQEEKLSIMLIDLQGKIVETLLPVTNRQAGSYTETYTFNRKFPAGTYLVQLVTKSGMQTEKVLIL